MVLTVQAIKLLVFPGVNCLRHPVLYGANCSSHHLLSFFAGVKLFERPYFLWCLLFKPSSYQSFTGVNCLSHPIFYGANCSSHHLLSFFAGVKLFEPPYFLWCLLFKPSCYQSFTGVNCLRHPVLYGANCSSHRVVNCYVNHPPFFMVLTVRASVIFLPSGAINVWGTAILFISLEVYNQVLVINYSVLTLHPQICY